MKVKNDLSDLTIIIFGYERHGKLIESLQYWSKFKFKVLVFHHTKTPLDNRWVGSNIDYFSGLLNLPGRFELTSKILNGKYCITVSDDERFFPSTLISMMSYMNDNLEVTSVGAQCVAIRRYGLKQFIIPAYISMYEYNNFHSNFMKRFSYHFLGKRNGSISPAYYRMFKVEDARKYFEMLAKMNGFSTPYIFEVTAEIFWTFSGPCVYLSKVFWIRNWVNPPIQKENWDRRIYFSDWYGSEVYKHEVKRWETLLEEYIFNKIDHKSWKKSLFKVSSFREKLEFHEKSKDLYSKRNRRVRQLIQVVLSPFREMPISRDTLIFLQSRDIFIDKNELNTILLSIR